MFGTAGAGHRKAAKRKHKKENPMYHSCFDAVTLEMGTKQVEQKLYASFAVHSNVKKQESNAYYIITHLRDISVSVPLLNGACYSQLVLETSSNPCLL